MRLLMLFALFELALDQMTNRPNGMGFDHPRSGIAHDLPDFLAHIRFIAMDSAIGAERLALHKRAFVAALVRIGDQF